MLLRTILVVATILVLASATEVRECQNVSEKVQREISEVQISGCETPPCKLKKKTKATIEQAFTPEREIQNLKNSVNAVVVGVPLPFIGVDGTDARKQIFNADGTEATWPLKKGQKYIYRNTFPILQIYPTLSLVVHYSLKEGNDIVACFEVPAKITN